MTSLLTLRNVSAGYGKTPALFDISLSVAAGQAVALMGRNGMGKSTTVKAICRMLPASGDLNFDGNDLLALPSHRAAQLGIGLVPEGRRCFGDLTVTENLLAAARPGAWSLDRIEVMFPKLAERRNQPARSLSGGEQQMLAISRALMTNPRLLILDEATEGLAPVVRQEIWEAIAQVKTEKGLSLLIIDKSLKELRQVVDTVVMVEKGRTVWNGAIGTLTDDILHRYVGV